MDNRNTDEEFIFMEFDENKHSKNLREKHIREISNQIESIYHIMDDLNDMVTQQQKDIDILEKNINKTLIDVNQTSEITTKISSNNIKKLKYLYTFIAGIGVILLSLIKS